MRDLALPPDHLPAAEYRGNVVGKVCVETPTHSHTLVQSAHAADELDGGVEVAEEETGAREKEVADAGQLEAEAQSGPLVDLHVHVD